MPEREKEFVKKKDDECAALSGVQSTPHLAERWIFGLSLSEFHEAQLADDNIRQSCLAVEGDATETTRMATR